MAEYIDKQAFLAHMMGTSRYFTVKFDIEEFTAADVAPVVHGRWKKSGSLLECQYCGEIYSQLGGNAGKSWNYCPNCGAKMDGDGSGK